MSYSLTLSGLNSKSCPPVSVSLSVSVPFTISVLVSESSAVMPCVVMSIVVVPFSTVLSLSEYHLLLSHNDLLPRPAYNSVSISRFVLSSCLVFVFVSDSP